MFAPEVLTPTVDRLAALAGDGRALELAIGTGRVAIPLRERGVEVVGIELSRPMIARLREKVGEDEVAVVHGDMASASAPGEYTLVYLVFNTIANLLTQDAQVECFRNAARHLRPGGRFLVELWVPELRLVPPGREAAVFTARDGYLGIDVFDIPQQRVVSRHVVWDPDGGGRGAARVGSTPHRYIWPAELDLMARLAGLELESRHADFAGAEFTGESPSHVSVYRLPPERP